jgi:hypothetical protein
MFNLLYSVSSKPEHVGYFISRELGKYKKSMLGVGSAWEVYQCRCTSARRPWAHIIPVPLLAGKLIWTLTRSEGPAAFMGLLQGQMERRIGMELVA